MRIKILDEPVRQNVELFLQILRKAKEKQGPKATHAEEVFKAWLNTDTGQMLYTEGKEASQYLGKKEWKPVSFGYQYEPRSGEIQFVVRVAEEKETLLRSDDLAPMAFRVFRETLKVFSEIGKLLKGPSDLDTKISVLSNVAIIAEASHADRNMIIDLWHHADRMQAESLLFNKPVGTYFFRKDPIASVLEMQLEKELHKRVKCFTLTYSQEGKKISDCTLVHVDLAWQIYDDDPSLTQKSFKELKDIVASQKNVLKYPLYRPMP